MNLSYFLLKIIYPIKLENIYFIEKKQPMQIRDHAHQIYRMIGSHIMIVLFFLKIKVISNRC